jgi:transposase
LTDPANIDPDGLPALRSFVRGLRRDHDTVTAGLTLPHNSGAIEGHVNRLKKIKRQMFGRAKPDLLRKRVLLGDRPAPEPITKTVPDPRLARR